MTPETFIRQSTSRRTFIRHASYGAAATVAASSLVSRLAAAVPADTTFTASTDSETDLLYMSATKLAGMIRSKQISSVEVLELYLARIAAVNPKINAVVALCSERALSEAKAADAMLAKGKLMGPLHGVPMTIKDSFDTKGVVSTGGTLGRKDFVPGIDATVVARLRAAGAILIGKSNTPEFTLGGGGKGTVNLVYGLTSNPYNTDYQPSGSSGGAGAIVAAGGAAFDIGTDYGGSIRGPAFANGIAGLKPTYGTVPRTGHIVGYGGPFDNWQEAGPLARRVEDIALIMPIINGPDDWDCAMAPVPLGDPALVDISKLRVAYYTTNGQVDPTQEVIDMVKQCVAYFKKAGCPISEDRPPKMKELGEVRSAFGNANGREHMQRLLAIHGTKQASPGLRLTGEVLPSSDLTRLCEEMDAIKSEQLAWFEQYDVIICPPSQQGPVRHDYERPKNRSGYSYNSQYNTTGWPAGVVRASTTAVDAMPLGIQIVGQPWRDDVVMAAMAFVESKTGGYKRPSI
jgi:amidase